MYDRATALHCEGQETVLYSPCSLRTTGLAIDETGVRRSPKMVTLMGRMEQDRSAD